MKKNRDEFATKKLKAYAKSENKLLVKGSIFSILRTLLEILGPMIIANILNKYIKKGMTGDDFRSISLNLSLYFLVYVSSGLLLNRTRVAFGTASNEIAYTIQKDVYKKVNSLPISYFDSISSGSIASRVTNDTNKLKNMFQLLFSDIFTASIFSLGMVIAIAVTNKVALLMLLVLVPLIVYIYKSFTRKISEYTKNIKVYTGEINAKINENIQNMEVIQAFNQEDYVYDNFDRTNKIIYDNYMKSTKLRSYSGYRAMDIIQYIATVIVILYFGLGRLSGKYAVSIGSLYMVIDYTSRLFSNLTTIVTRYGDVADSLSSASYIFELLKLPSMEELPEELEDANQPIEFDDVYFAYKEEDVLKGVSFYLEPGESMAFVGQTGSGKSTIINLLLNFYTPRRGAIYIGGQNINNVNRDSLRKDMAVVLQDAFIFEGTIRDNITLNEDFSDRQVISALEDVGGEVILKRGIDTKIIEGGSNLSAGEKQLISFARAYIRDPKILILDEATSNIDTETEAILQEGINRLKKDRTTFIVAHRLSTIKDVDKILVLGDGKILERGNHESLLKKGGIYKKMYDTQLKDSNK